MSVWVVSFQNEVIAVFVEWTILVKEIDRYDFDKIELVPFYD